MIQLIEHVAITVRNLQETIDFYAKLGFKPTQRSETPVQTIQFLEVGQARLEVFIPKTPATTPPELGQSDVGIKHIALKVDDIWKVYEEAKARGLIFNAEPRRSPSGSVMTSLKDPNGILLQLIQR